MSCEPVASIALPAGIEEPDRSIAHKLARGAAQHRPIGLAANLYFRCVVFALVGGLDQEKRHSGCAVVIGQELLVHDRVGVGGVHVQPSVILILIDSGVFRVAMSRKQVTFVHFFDALGHGIHVFPGGVRIPVATHDPDDIVKITIPVANISPPGAALCRTIGERLLDPAFVGSDVTQINRRKEYLDPFFRRLANDPVRVLEVLFVWCREISGSRKRSFTIAIDRSVKLMLDQIDHDGIESFLPAVLQILLFLFAREARDEGPGASPWIRNGAPA